VRGASDLLLIDTAGGLDDRFVAQSGTAVPPLGDWIEGTSHRIVAFAANAGKRPNAGVWQSGVTLFKGLRWTLKPGAPLLVSPKPSWHKLSRMAEFITVIPRHEENTVTTVRLAI